MNATILGWLDRAMSTPPNTVLDVVTLMVYAVAVFVLTLVKTALVAVAVATIGYVLLGSVLLLCGVPMGLLLPGLAQRKKDI